MNLSSIVVLLQIALQLLVGAQTGTSAQKEQAQLFAGQAISLATQVLVQPGVSTTAQTTYTYPSSTPQQVVINNYYVTPTSTTNLGRQTTVITTTSTPAIPWAKVSAIRLDNNETYSCGRFTEHYYNTSNYPVCDVLRLTDGSTNYGYLPIDFRIVSEGGKVFIKKLSLALGGSVDMQNDIEGVYLHGVTIDGNPSSPLYPYPVSSLTIGRLEGKEVRNGIINGFVKIKPSADLKTISVTLNQLELMDEVGTVIDISKLTIPTRSAKLSVDPQYLP